MSKTYWSIEELIDLEYFIHLDDTVMDDNHRAALHDRDRSIYLETAGSADIDELPERQFTAYWLKKWLESRKIQEKSHNPDKLLFPGQIFGQVYLFLLFIFATIGIISGSGLCFSFLIYKGHEPINVSSYLGVFVFTQIFLLGFIIVLFLISRTNRSGKDISLIRYSISHLLVTLSIWLKKKSDHHLSAETRSELESTFGIIKGHSRHYGLLFPYPVFILTQVFAVFFNFGVLVATLLKIIGSDLAFGWQSTLQLSSQAVSKVVSVLSVPWSLFVPPAIAHPDIAQIEGTRIILKDGITRLATPDLVSWWPFLCFCVLFYGLIPRLLLLTGAVFFRQRALNQISFTSIACDRLFFRMTHPIVNTLSPYPDHQVPHDIGELNNPPLSRMTGRDNPCLVLVPEEISDIIDQPELKNHMRQIFGINTLNTVIITLDMMTDRKMLSETVPQFGGNRLVIIMEAWQPPIRENLLYIQETKAIGNADLMIYILLIGKPVQGNVMTKPDDLDTVIWQKKINSMADPNIKIEWVSPEQ